MRGCDRDKIKATRLSRGNKITASLLSLRRYRFIKYSARRKRSFERAIIRSCQFRFTLAVSASRERRVRRCGWLLSFCIFHRGKLGDYEIHFRTVIWIHLYLFGESLRYRNNLANSCGNYKHLPRPCQFDSFLENNCHNVVKVNR